MDIHTSIKLNDSTLYFAPICKKNHPTYIKTFFFSPTMTDINHLLFLQETIKTECRSIIDEQCKDATDYTDKQTLLNNLFVQHMDLNVKIAGLIVKPVIQRTGSVDE